MAPRKNDSTSWKRGAKESLWTIRKLDAEPILRYDLQYQVLDELFSDRTFRFTAPVDSKNPPSSPTYLNFDQLYLKALLGSGKTTLNLRNRLIENPTFSANFCKLCFLINIGRINTTLAFYPSMKTALRTYHPVPALQTDEMSRNQMQDAPRLKSLLKACFLDWELTQQQQPQTLHELALKSVSPKNLTDAVVPYCFLILDDVTQAALEPTQGPPTTVVNALFVLFNEAIWVADRYFPPGFDLLDLFYPADSPSLPRAQSFLSILHHILENKNFIQDFSPSLDKDAPIIELAPPLQLSKESSEEKENVDTQDEMDFIQEMQQIREGVVKLVPAIQKKDEEMRLAIQRRLEKEAAAAEMEANNVNAGTGAGGGGGEGGVGGGGTGGGAGIKKRKRKEGDMSRSWARFSRDNALAEKGVIEVLPLEWEKEDYSIEVPSNESGLPDAWNKVCRDMLDNRDPDYDSEDEETWSYDLLLRRRYLTFPHPLTGIRAPVQTFPEFEEWKRRGEAGQNGFLEGDDNEDEEVGGEGGDDGLEGGGDEDE
ncbi:BZ3500_MvSof-1268-A1-R1_Chr7-1g09269 [Microbotryum saponariae]|uniref:BZ3500_MvSof-1268-A1-R1_Chr7-1g09269 protein n=1 Tax=Microbotryum saponariae TaxID=289078 RepID=A0A2X0N796_9BASI|nr:BZ3501_MvSof-1269-A2-R1_Chr7-1g08974 [Microbotryum saponariae]SDA03122.1 BZ3500_MvSof-1268-A1-R1_Chr7-1g09269 [Microbotryum saponariae]